MSAAAPAASRRSSARTRSAAASESGIGREITREELIALAAAGDDGDRRGARRTLGRKLGLAVANMVTLLNPELLIICGEGTELGAAYLDPVVTAVREQTFADQGRTSR